MPFRSTADFDEQKIASIQSHQREGKPRASRTVRRLPQLIESKAFAKSSLSMIVDAFLAWQH
jgi:hypothetical protein